MTVYLSVKEFPYVFGDRRRAGTRWRRLVHREGCRASKASKYGTNQDWLLNRLAKANWALDVLGDPRIARVAGVAPVGMVGMELAGCVKCRPPMVGVLFALADWRDSAFERTKEYQRMEVEAAEARRMAADRGRAVEACRGRNHLIGVTVPMMAADELRRRHAEEYSALVAERRLRARVNGWLAEFLVRGE